MISKSKELRVALNVLQDVLLTLTARNSLRDQSVGLARIIGQKSEKKIIISSCRTSRT
jgi:hypothetical protein